MTISRVVSLSAQAGSRKKHYGGVCSPLPPGCRFRHSANSALVQGQELTNGHQMAGLHFGVDAPCANMGFNGIHTAHLMSLAHDIQKMKQKMGRIYVQYACVDIRPQFSVSQILVSTQEMPYGIRFKLQQFRLNLCSYTR